MSDKQICLFTPIHPVYDQTYCIPVYQQCSCSSARYAKSVFYVLYEILIYDISWYLDQALLYDSLSICM